MKTVTEIITILGGGAEAARALGVTHQAVSNWMARNRIPSAYAQYIVLNTSGNPDPVTYEELLK
jgi:DNA-binding transcriptional regulator YdaS (Cro superfamily)